MSSPPRPAPGGRAATVHAFGCRLAGSHAHPLHTMQALEALARPGTIA
ncbi:DUF6233 domain-containing protein [Streptomyces sp. NPDC059656]